MYAVVAGPSFLSSCVGKPFASLVSTPQGGKTYCICVHRKTTHTIKKKKTTAHLSIFVSKIWGGGKRARKDSLLLHLLYFMICFLVVERERERDLERGNYWTCSLPPLSPPSSSFPMPPSHHPLWSEEMNKRSIKEDGRLIFSLLSLFFWVGKRYHLLSQEFFSPQGFPLFFFAICHGAFPPPPFLVSSSHMFFLANVCKQVRDGPTNSGKKEEVQIAVGAP